MIPSSSITMGKSPTIPSNRDIRGPIPYQRRTFRPKTRLDFSRSRYLLSSAPLFVEFHPGGEYCRDVEGRGIGENSWLSKCCFHLTLIFLTLIFVGFRPSKIHMALSLKTRNFNFGDPTTPRTPNSCKAVQGQSGISEGRIFVS